MKRFDDLTEAEILALAISNEEEDARIYLQFAGRLKADYPATAAMFERMAQEEHGHRHALNELYGRKFGGELPYITRQDVKGFLKRNPIWLLDTLRIDAVRRQAEMMEYEAQQFYAKAAERARDADVRQLLADLAEAESAHETLAQELGGRIDDQRRQGGGGSHRPPHLRAADRPAGPRRPHRRLDLDAGADLRRRLRHAGFSWAAFLVGLAASLGAGISMGLTEALSDDGAITGRGSPWPRGIACGVMTTLGGLGHTLPYLIPDFWTATAVAGVVVAFELAAIAYVRTRYMETPFTSAIVQVVLGGILVLLTGILIGSS